jgi:hypothetical protein
MGHVREVGERFDWLSRNLADFVFNPSFGQAERYINLAFRLRNAIINRL